MTQNSVPNPESSASTFSRRGRRSLFWPGFVIGFLLLSAITCAGGVLVAGLDELKLTDLRALQAAAWTPPAVTPTPLVALTLADPAEDDSQDVSELRIGDTAFNVTSSRVNVRRTPGYLGKPDGDVIAQVAPGARIVLIDGPTSADSLTWWLVRYAVDGRGPVEGWMAEATASGVQILGR